jgi:mRNA interferase MazF
MPPHAYVPDANDVVWLQFDPQAGHEQAAHRHALVISPAKYSGQTVWGVCCPMPTKPKGIRSRWSPESTALIVRSCRAR